MYITLSSPKVVLPHYMWGSSFIYKHVGFIYDSSVTHVGDNQLFRDVDSWVILGSWQPDTYYVLVLPTSTIRECEQ